MAVAILLLPALLYRALLPVGFMPMVEANGVFELGLCPGTVDGVTFIAAAANPHAHHHHGSGSASEHGSPSAPCPYALSGTAPLTAEPFALPLLSPVNEKPRSATAAAVFLPTILRVQSPRAPPALA
jgi:hypothetical protein